MRTVIGLLINYFYYEYRVKQAMRLMLGHACLISDRQAGLLRAWPMNLNLGVMSTGFSRHHCEVVFKQLAACMMKVSGRTRQDPGTDTVRFEILIWSLVS